MTERQESSGGIVMGTEGAQLKILLIEDRFGYWTWPKGHIEEGETPEDAALREIEEETGIAGLRILREIGTQKYSFSCDEGEVLKTVHVFLMEASSCGRVRAQTGEIFSAGWFSEEESLRKIGYEGSLDIMNKAIKMYNELKG